MPNGNLEKIVIFASLLLLASMLLHGVIHHEHPEEIFGGGEQAAFHSEDRKWWMLILLSSLLFIFGGLIRNRLTCGGQIFPNRIFSLTFGFSKVFDPIREALRTGILNPKLCE